MDLNVEFLFAQDIDEFIEMAYAIILGRSADPGGISHYRKLLHAGGSRMSVLYDLYYSREANKSILGEVTEDMKLQIEMHINEEKLSRSWYGWLFAPLLLSKRMGRLEAALLGKNIRQSQPAQGHILHHDDGLDAQGIGRSKRIRYAVRITGGIGDALIIARFIRDFQNQLGHRLNFDVYFHTPDLVKYFFGAIPGFRAAVHSDIFNRVVDTYDFALLTNQYVTFANEHIKVQRIAYLRPEVLNIYSKIERDRVKIEKYIQQHPNLDGAFADLATKQGFKRYTYLHHLAGVPYGGDELHIKGINSSVVNKYDLEHKSYITVHDGWDTKFDFKKYVDRPTKAFPIEKWNEVVGILKKNVPDLIVVQVGGKTGQSIDGVDINLKNKLSLIDSINLLSRSKLHIDSESGLVHIASALGVKSAVIFGPTNSHWFGYEKNINITPVKCGNCWWSTDTWMEACPAGYDIPICMHHHSVKDIADLLVNDLRVRLNM